MKTLGETYIAHLFDDAIFLRYYHHFISAFFKQERHEFITNAAGNCSINSSGNDSETTFTTFVRSENIRKPLQFIKRTFQTLQEMDKSKLIIVHGFTEIDLLYFCLCPPLIRKTVWVIWGYDLYDYRTRKSSLYSRIRFLAKKHIVKRVPYVISNVGDYKLLQKWYGVSPKLFQVYSLYGNGCTNVKLHIRQKDTRTINILLGNSATPTNRHTESLEILRKYNSEDIRIYIPLSYGDKEYAKSVAEYARGIFGDKVVILEKMMNTEAYNDFLSTMDIAVFNQNRQQGVGNLTYMFQSGVKIFLNDDNPLCEYYTELNLPVNSINTIPEMSFDEFIFVDPLDVQASTQRARDIFSEETLVKQWNEVFALAKK